MKFAEACKEVLSNNKKFKRDISVGIRNVDDKIHFYDPSDDSDDCITQAIMLSDITNDWTEIKSKEEDVLAYVKELVENSSYEYANSIEPVITERFITLELPVCNRKWTFEVWRIAKLVCDKFKGVYPFQSSERSGKKIWLDMGQL